MKTNQVLKKVLFVAGALAAWEFIATWWEKGKLKQANDYWKTYYDQATVKEAERIRQGASISSTGVRVHIDIYPGPKPDSPVLIFNHGAAGYCRLFVGLALRLRARGYTVILPDQRGQGLSGGRRGDYTIAECVQNIADIVRWAKTRYPGPIFMAGGSVGGGLTYYAAAGTPVQAIACLNLFDFGNGLDGLHISRLRWLAHCPKLVTWLQAGFQLLRPFDGLRLPFNWFGNFAKLMDARDASFQAQWDADPTPPRLISLRSLSSNLGSPPPIAFEDNSIPTLVINQARDEMVDVSVTRRNYERLGGKKHYLEIPFGHWSNQPEFWDAVTQACDDWFQSST